MPKLKNLIISKVDFVKNGANPEAHIELFKNEAKSTAMKFFEKVNERYGAGADDLAKSEDAKTFKEKLSEKSMRDIFDMIWWVTSALSESLVTVLTNSDIKDKEKMMLANLKQFCDIAAKLIPAWSKGEKGVIEGYDGVDNADGELSDVEIAIANMSVENICRSLGKAVSATIEYTLDENSDEKNENLYKNNKGVDVDMKFDESKLSPDEIKTLRELEAKAGIKEERTQSIDAEKSESGKGKDQPAEDIEATEKKKGECGVKKSAEPEDIYKGLHPAVKAEIIALKKAAAENEERELTEIAKKYVILGKKPEDLVPLFKSMKKAGDGSYENMISVLDASLSAVNESGIFNEIGKSGDGVFRRRASETEARKAAEEIKKSAPGISDVEAMARAWEENPELMMKFDEEIGG